MTTKIVSLAVAALLVAASSTAFAQSVNSSTNTGAAGTTGLPDTSAGSNMQVKKNGSGLSGSASTQTKSKSTTGSGGTKGDTYMRAAPDTGGVSARSGVSGGASR